MDVLSMQEHVSCGVSSSFGCSKIKAIGIIAAGMPGARYTPNVHVGCLPHLDVPRSKPLVSLQQVCQELGTLLTSMVDYKYTILGGRESDLQSLALSLSTRNKQYLLMHMHSRSRRLHPTHRFALFSYSYNSREEGHMFVIMFCSQSVATIT